MLVVISDTSPLNYIVWLGEAEILHRLYGHVLIPAAVMEELQSEGAPPTLRSWVARPPNWLEVVPRRVPAASDLGLELLGEGEQEAIALALDRHADLVLMDDREGVEEARRLGLTVTGTLGVLQRAAEKKLINLQEAIERLRSTNFRASPDVIQALLRQSEDDKE